MFDTPSNIELEALTDEWTVNRLFAGDLAPDDLPSELSGLAVLVGALTAPPDPAELANLDAALAAVSATRTVLEARRQARARRYRVASAVAAAATGVLVVGSGLAVADVLPGPAQRFASDVLAHVGVHVDHPDHTTSPAPNASTNHAGSTVSGVASTPSTGPGKGAVVSGTASDDRSRATTPSTTPPTSTLRVPVPQAAPQTAPHPSASPATPPTSPGSSPGSSPPTPRPPDTTRATPAAPGTAGDHRP